MSAPLVISTETPPNPFVGRALAGLLLGEEIGRGCYRMVYAHATDPGLVVKIEPGVTGRFCNVDEYNLWDDVQDYPEIARWFAPVRFISACGSVMIQERTKPIGRLPAKVPNLFSDLKPENWGRLKGRPVMHDYANNKISLHAIKRFKLVDRL